MKRRTGYKTRQRDLILEFLKNNMDRQLLIHEIVDAVGSCAGKSTVYRYISEMTSAGIVRRFRGEDGRTVYYQYAGESRECDEHFHLKCINCGKLIHLECGHMAELAGHIGQKHGFTLDAAQCVLYGKCEYCKRGKTR